MKLSDNFASHLKEAHAFYTSPDFDFENLWEPAIGKRYEEQMFLLEGKDFDKAIAVFKHKRFASRYYAEGYSRVKEPYLNTDLSVPEERKLLRERRLFSFNVGDEFVKDIWDECSCKKKESGRLFLEALLHELWYSQPDYQLVKNVREQYFSLCRFWVARNRVEHKQEEMECSYNELLKS